MPGVQYIVHHFSVTFNINKTFKMENMVFLYYLMGEFTEKYNLLILNKFQAYVG